MSKPSRPDLSARPAPQGGIQPRAEPTLSDPTGRDIDAMLDDLGRQPREERPKWTKESAGREAAHYEGQAVPAPAHPTPPVEERVVVRPSAIAPRTTVLVDRVARQRTIVRLLVASVAALGVLVVLAIVFRYVGNRPTSSNASPTTAPPRETASPGALTTATASEAPTAVVTADTATTAASSSPPPSSTAPAPKAPSATTTTGVTTGSPTPPRPTGSVGHSNLYDPNRQ